MASDWESELRHMKGWCVEKHLYAKIIDMLKSSHEKNVGIKEFNCFGYLGSISRLCGALCVTVWYQLDNVS